MIIIYNVVMILCFIFSMYFVITALFTFKSRKKIAISNKYHKFAILVPARNEAGVIANLLESIEAMDYPKNLYSVYCLPNNCQDNTIEVAKRKKAQIIPITVPVKSKGEVLQYAFNYLKNSDYDAYVVIDADNVVHQNFLKVMNKSLNEGYLVVQGFRDAKNPHDNYITGSYTMFYYLQNIFYNQARYNLKRSAVLNGTGFCLKKQVIDDIGFPVKTLTEDSEFTGICALNNIKIGFAKDAIVYDEHPLTFKSSWVQRKRWSSGCLECLRIYSPSLIKNIFCNASGLALDCLLYYLTPLVQVLSFILPLGMFILIFSEGLLKHQLILDLTGLFIFIILYIGSIILNIIVIKMLHKKPQNYYQGIFGFSFFILTWIPINILCLFKKTKKWEEIKHTRVISIKNFLN